ncbi:hypothetical protein J7M28_07870 [bacterium]|nr:hypothetical protein [bacterium]
MNRVISLLLMLLVALIALPESSYSSSGCSVEPNHYAWQPATNGCGCYSRAVHLSVAEELFEAGITLLSEMKFDAAADCFWQVVNIYGGSSTLKDNPRVADAYYFLGKTYLLSGRANVPSGLFYISIASCTESVFIRPQVELVFQADERPMQRLRGFARDRQLESQLMRNSKRAK